MTITILNVSEIMTKMEKMWDWVICINKKTNSRTDCYRFLPPNQTVTL